MTIPKLTGTGRRADGRMGGQAQVSLGMDAHSIIPIVSNIFGKVTQVYIERLILWRGPEIFVTCKDHEADKKI